jgi:uncharacterized protein (DUF697 family)
MPRSHPSLKKSAGGRIVGRFLRFGFLRGLRSVEIDPEVFRRELASKHGLWIPGFSFGGMVTFLPDAGLLTLITLRLIQRLCLLYGFESRGQDARLEMWKAAAAAAGVDYGKDLVEKQMLEKIAPSIARRLAAKLGQESAEKWAGRMIPFASSAIGGALNFSFVRAWGRRVQRHLRSEHLTARIPQPAPGASRVPSSVTLV